MFVCPDCGREFTRRVFLSLHKNTHNRVKLWCKLCGKVFHLQSQLQQHVRSHGFSHLRRHTKKWWSLSLRHRIFRCSKCCTTFLKPTDLSTHMFKVHAVVPKTRLVIPLETHSTVMSSTIVELPVGSGFDASKADCLTQDSCAESLNSDEMQNSVELDRSSSPTFGAKSTFTQSKGAMCIHDSPTKSPGCLARERLLRKYLRPHVSSPATRKLFLDQHASETNKVPNLRKRNRGDNDPNMPRLTEVSILLERIDCLNNGSIIHRNNKITSKKNDTVIEKQVKAKEPGILKRSDSSDSEDRMPHLHRFSSEEKHSYDVDGETWLSDNDSPTSICVDKFDVFKQREGLFDILQQEHEKSSPRNNEKKSNSTEKIIQPTNGLVLKKHIFLDACKLSPPKKSDIPVSEVITNNLSKKSHKSRKVERALSPVLLDVSDQQLLEQQNQSGRKMSADEGVLILPRNSRDHSQDELSMMSDIKVPSIKFSPPFCYSERPNGTDSLHSPTLRPKKHHVEAISFMSDLSELKHDREDQAESYPNSLSSLDDGPDPVTQLIHNLHAQFVNRQLSCPVPSNIEVQVKRNRTMTISGRPSDLQGQRPTKAREKRKRSKTLSHGCSCCMDVGPSRKRRRRYSRPKTKTSWSIPHILTEEQQAFVDSSTYLISLRHKVFRLCQVLFPKLSTFWELNADTEQVDILVSEISDVIKSLKETQSQEPLSKQTLMLCEDRGLKRSQDVPQNLQNSEHISNTPITSMFLSVVDSEKILNSNVGTQIQNDEFISSTAETTKSVGGHLNCLIAKESTAESKLPPLDSSENIEQTSSENNDFSSSDIQERLSEQEIQNEIKPSCSSSYKSQENVNNNSTSKSNVPLTSSGAMWGSGLNNQWEHEFFHYLSKSTALNKPKTLLTPKPFKKETSSLTAEPCEPFLCDIGLNTEPDIDCDQPAPRLLDVKVELCKDPQICLTQLRRNVIHLLQPLLPNLTLENNFDKFSNDVDMLVDLVTQSNEKKVL